MTGLSRRNFMALTAAAGDARAIPVAINARKGKYLVRMVYDKSIGAMRLIERWVP